MPTLGEKIELLRKERGWSQRRLAQAVEVTNSAVSQWESDKVVPGYEKLNALSSLFSTSLLAHNSDVKPSRMAAGRAVVLDASEICDGLPTALSGRKTVEPSIVPTGSSFAITMPDRGMIPDILKGELVIVDTGLVAGPSDFVVAAVRDEVHGMVRRLRLVEDGQAFELVPNNQDFIPQRFLMNDPCCTILGVVVESRRLRDAF